MKISVWIVSAVLSLNVISAQLSPYSYEFDAGNYAKSQSITPLSNSILDIIVSGDTLWVGTTRGLSRSFDKGVSWTNYYNDGDFGTESITAIAYGDGVIWTAAGKSVERDGQNLPAGAGLKYSTDHGETWNQIPQPLDDPGDSSVIYGINTLRALPITTEINNITYDLALTKNTVWIATFAGGLRKSTDMGQTWHRVVLPPDYLSSIDPADTLNFALQPVAGKFGNESYLNHRVFSVIGVDDSTLYAGSANGINRSTDNGISWVKFNRTNQDEPISGNFITALNYNPADQSVWAASWQAEGSTEYYAVSASGNGGESWKTFLPGEKAHNFGFKNVYGGTGIQSIETIAATDNGLYRTQDFGTTWITPASLNDDQKLLSILTNEFYSVNVQKDNSGYIIWAGSSSEGLAKLSEVNGIWSGNWSILLASQPTAPLTETYAFPNPFSPNNEYTRIKYTMGDGGGSVTIRILDFGMNLVRTLIQNLSKNPNSDNFEYWDGRDENGSIVANGVYFYRIDVDSNEPMFGKIMVLR